MTYEKLPTVDRFNSLSVEDRKNAYWCDIYANYYHESIHHKDDGAWVIHKVNNYYVLAFFTYPPEAEKKEIFSGELRKIYASEDFIDFIYSERRDIWDKWINTSFYIPEDFKVPEKNYYSNYLFVDAKYKEVLDNVSSFFYDDYRMYPIDSDYHTVRSELIRDWNIFEEKNSEMLYFSADDYNFVGSGISVQIINSHLQIEQGYLTQPIPSIIFKKCKNVPHIIEIGFSRSRGYAKIGYEVMENLAKKFGGRAYMVSSDFRIMAIKANKYLSTEEKIEHLIGSLSDNISEESFKLCALEVSTLLGAYWDMLTENSKRFIATGFFHYHYAIRNASILFDTSNPSISFSKVIETEIEHKIIIPFREYFVSIYSADDLTYDLHDENLKRMSLYLLNSSQKPPELGSFAYFIGNAIRSKKRAEKSGSIKAFREFCQTRKDPNFFLDENEFYDKLSLISKKYRNGSAHTEILSIGKLKDFYNLLFHDEFLKNLLEKSKPINR